MAEKLFEFTDRSRLVTTAVFREQAPDVASQFTDFPVRLPDGPDTADMAVIGGGALGARLPEGVLLTASHHASDLLGWLVSSKDHRLAQPHRIVGYAIGLKIAGMSRDDLRNVMEFGIKRSSSDDDGGGPVSRPVARAHAPADHVLVSGGFRVQWSGAGNLATASFPELGDQSRLGEAWVAKSKDHVANSPATVDVIAMSLPTQLVGKRVVRAVRVAETDPVEFPEVSLPLEGGFALTGIGAEVRWTPPGNLLWGLAPTAQQEQLPGVTAGAKEHEQASFASLKAWAIGIQLV